MINCQNCGQSNAQNSNFCRSCGLRLLIPQPAATSSFEVDPPRPYSWKTDEFKTNDGRGRKTPPIRQVEPLAKFQTPGSLPVQYTGQPPAAVAHGYRCPRCATQIPPVFSRRVSPAGWIVFAILLAFTLIFCWIGLLIKEDVRVCPICNLKLT